MNDIDSHQRRGVWLGVNADRAGHRAPLTHRKNSPLEGVNVLTGQKRKYALALMSGSSQAEAARKAGYSEKTARSQGSRLAKDPDVIAFINKKRAADPYDVPTGMKALHHLQ
jgi:DNA-binding CsgD family transcriptional regulator